MLKLSTILDLIKATGVDLTHYESRFNRLPFYSKFIYGLTYEENYAEIELLAETMKRFKKTNNCRVLELFGGKAFESHALSKVFPRNHYSAIDNADYFEKYKKIEYIQGDVYKDSLIHRADVIFASPTSSGLCVVRNFDDLRRTAKFCRENLKHKGIVVVSFFEDFFYELDNSEFRIEYIARKCKYNQAYKGQEIHWFKITHRKREFDTYTLYNVVVLKDKQNFTNFYYNNDNEGTFRAWSAAQVLEAFRSQGLYPVPDYSISCENMVFKTGS